ncbi:hypothetical protein [Pseudomonas mediterranea]|uniref:Uncharacterized protein n=1 Tax=Pseudomonas mediterranea TaxID=183795 RepID=A0AAX2D5W3_9PSED|nr:hypothetical protein [Pseudomonas mediterranea]KGU82394.1 hypothetical protein N005_27455 [Pseudomonas mediterranea CFBP 5447]CAH0307517.1 hypothetical protein SRABI112_04748 [Pseudomonas mediterranea]SDU10880.1 hypothetical protein SAMN05216476_0467 [Pseudomonas mediterranea]
MGVAFGQFVPADGYQAIQQECRANHLDQSALALCAQTEAGLVIPCAGIGILDYLEELLPELIEINILGIPRPLYEELFPEKVARYKRQFIS